MNMSVVRVHVIVTSRKRKYDKGPVKKRDNRGNDGDDYDKADKRAFKDIIPILENAKQQLVPGEGLGPSILRV